MSLEAQGIITGLKPLGGWRYPQPFNGSFSHIEPTHAPNGHYPNYGEKLLAAVILFRQTHAIPPGEPERDVAEFIRRASPQNDYYHGKLPDVIGKPRLKSITPLIEDLRNWIETEILLRPALVNVLDATDRAQICIKCPQNIKWRTSCGECNDKVDQRGIVLRGFVNFDYDPALLGCRVHRIALQPAVFIDRDFLPKRSDKAPSHCWIP